MSLFRSLVSSVHGALLLARGQPRGIMTMEIGARGVARSFWAIPLSLPPVLYLATLDWPDGAPPPHFGIELLRHGAVFVVAWLAYAAFTHRIAGRLDRPVLWAPMIVAWNWCGVPENMLLVLGTFPGSLGAPHLVDQVAQLATFGWAVWIEWFAIRLAFGASPLLAVWLVLVDQSLGILFTLADLALSPS